MTAKQTLAPELRTLMTGLAMGESPRWHEDRLWFSDWGAQEIIAVDVDGRSEVAVRVPFALPFCIDWLTEGRLLIVSGREGLVMRTERDGSLVTHADLRSLSAYGWNEIVVDGRGNAYINGGPGIVLVAPDGSVRQVAESFAFPNGMTITPDNSTLIIAESHGKKRTAFDIGADGRRSDWRQTRDANEEVLGAWRTIYQSPAQYWMLYQLAEKLVDFEDYFRRWRFNHVTTVERVIGFKRGTGGTSGVSYLRKMLDVVLFAELWQVRTEL